MIHDTTDSSKPAIDRTRRRYVAKLVRKVGLHTKPISDDARLAYIVGALVCDDSGKIGRAALDAALADANVVHIARSILALTRPGAVRP